MTATARPSPVPRPVAGNSPPLPFNGTLGKYRLLRCLGEGGMGVVFAAEDTLLKRSVAIKLLPEKMARSPLALERFLREAQATARLNHPNVVAVYEVDQRDGIYYLVMEMVRGGSAQDYLQRHGQFAWRDATRTIAEVCRGLAAAHAAGLIHRDIKPANLMFQVADNGLLADNQSTSPVSRSTVANPLSVTPKITDFGLVKSLDDASDSNLTRVGQIVGTPLFMSPEQCRSMPLDARSDLYALGIAYFTLLIGRPPFEAQDPLAVMFAQCSTPVPDVRQLRDGLPAACDAIIRKAMAKEPAERFQSAAAMLVDLENLLGGDSKVFAARLVAPGASGVRSKMPSSAGKPAKDPSNSAMACTPAPLKTSEMPAAKSKLNASGVAKKKTDTNAASFGPKSQVLSKKKAKRKSRYRTWAVLGSTAVIGLSAIFIYSLIGSRTATGEQESSAPAIISRSQPPPRQARLEQNDKPHDLQPSSSKPPPQQAQPTERPPADSAKSPDSEKRPEQPPNSVKPTPKFAFSIEQVFIKGSVSFSAGGKVSALSYARNGKMFAASLLDGEKGVKAWDWPSGEERGHHWPEVSVSSMVVLPGNQALAAIHAQGNGLHIWNALTGTERTIFGAEGAGQPRSVGVARDGMFFVGFAPPPTRNAVYLRLWDFGAEQPNQGVLTGVQSPIVAVALSGDSKLAAASSEDGNVRIWDVSQKKLLQTLSVGRGKDGVGPLLAINPDGKRLAVAVNTDKENAVKLVDPATGKDQPPTGLHSAEGTIRAVAFSHDGKLLAAACGSAVKLWDAATGREMHVFRGHEGDVLSLAFSANDRVLASGGNDGVIRLSDISRFHRSVK